MRILAVPQNRQQALHKVVKVYRLRRAVSLLNFSARFKGLGFENGTDLNQNTLCFRLRFNSNSEPAAPRTGVLHTMTTRCTAHHDIRLDTRFFGAENAELRKGATAKR